MLKPAFLAVVVVIILVGEYCRVFRHHSAPGSRQERTMSGLVNQLVQEWVQLTEQISKFHDEQPTFLPTEYIKRTLMPTILVVAICLTVLYALCFQFVTVNKNSIVKTQKQRIKVCYQITNIIFNICIGAIGCYLEYVILPTLDCYNKASVEKIVGYEQELYLVSAFQLGYQLWAIPVGVLHVGEDMTMLLHHFAVVISASMTGFLSIGFRYYSPFFYGVMELSSIPLSVMNSFKDNKELRDKYPTVNAMSRAAFVSSFLLIRIILCLSRWPVFLRDNFIVFYTQPMGFYKFYSFLQWSLAVTLQLLQLYWATLIIKGVVKVAIGGKSKDKRQQKQKTEKES